MVDLHLQKLGPTKVKYCEKDSSVKNEMTHLHLFLKIYQKYNNENTWIWHLQSLFILTFFKKMRQTGYFLVWEFIKPILQDKKHALEKRPNQKNMEPYSSSLLSKLFAEQKQCVCQGPHSQNNLTQILATKTFYGSCFMQ